MPVPVTTCTSADDVRAAAIANAAWRSRVMRPAPRPVASPVPAAATASRRELWKRPARILGIKSRRIVEVCAAHFRVSVDDVLGPSRLKPLVNARHVSMWILREMRGFSFPQIAKTMGKADHTTPLHGCRHVDDTPALRAAALEIIAELAEVAAAPVEGDGAEHG
jgi:hypothetical protein